MGDSMNLINREGQSITVPASEAAQLLSASNDWRVETGTDVADRAQTNADDAVYGGAAGTTLAAGAGVARGFTGGGSDALISALGGGEQLRKLQEHHGVASVGGEIIGALSPTGIGGIAARAGEAVTGRIAGAGLRSVLGAAAGTAVEGGILGAGQGVSELSLSDDPLSVERVASTLGSNILFGAATGGALGAAGKGIELGLGKARGALDKIATREADAAANVGDDLTKLDRKGLREAEKQEQQTLEAARVPERAKVADELKAFRAETRENKLFLATKDATGEVREVAARSAKADKQIRNLLDNPIRLAEKPELAKAALQQQEAALQDLISKHSEGLRATFAADETGVRAAALDYAPVALEKNRALQAKIGELTDKATSPRLEAISDAMNGLGKATTKESATIGDVLGASALGHMVSAATGVPYLGQAVLAAKAVGGVMKKLGANAGEAAARGSKAIETFLDVGSKVARPTPVIASKVLARVRYGDDTSEKKQRTVAEHYEARASELRSMTAPGPDGTPIMRPEARAKVAERLAPVRAASPLLADRIETNKAAAVEFLAGKLARKPDLPGMGPHDKWQPSDMEMRAFARYAAAVEDPHGVVERLASGDVTPEDAEAMRAVYPEMYMHIQQEIMGRLGELRARLPYKRRLAMSIFSGIAVDPALDPRVLAILQGTFANEEGTSNGTAAPRAQAQFGSVSKPEATPAQRRGGE